ncbi:MAG: glycosyltransferase, partial [Lysobacterales bacterium]
SDFQRVEAQNALILGSSSWKITRPLRVGRRAAKNFMLARAWNPARWPWLFAQLVRNLSTLGVSGTIQRLQYTGPEASPEPQPVYVAEAIGEVQTPSDFPLTQNPHVSIVIPVYNKWNYTAACLCSLLEVKGKYTFEVIVVDDQSSDETAEQLAGIKGLTHLRNEENLGFVGSCNRGARHARGEYLVLLNNDTQVLDGWLDELIDTFAREPQAGLVGARLVYPDGSLQESGGIIFKDGSGWNYGREQQAENPEYLFLREVDYCSGACIALKTRYFLDLGAFDERYAPAYYEDTDLAFRVRESGLKVFVQPLSTIIHHEGITSGTDTSSGAKKYQLVNQEKFLERWQDELKSQPDKISNPDDHAEVLRASQHRTRGRILIIDATTPEPDKDSGSVRLTNLMQCCRDLGYGVTFFADNRDYNGSYSRDLQRSGIEVLYHPWLESLHDFFRDRGNEFDYVFISRHYIAINYVSLLKRYCPDAQFIFDTVDLHYLREQRLADLVQSLPLKRVAQQTRRAELSVIRDADATLVVSTVEKAVLEDDAPGEKVHILSNIHEVPGRDKEFSDRKDIYFVGGYQHPPNVDAACWFVNDIWPLIHKQLPEMRFHLIGSKAPERIRSLSGDGVVFHGFVETLDPFLSDCRLAVAPLRYGAGVKGKVNMSMAHGQPVVATPAAVEGMFAEHERELLVANDAEYFAAQVVRLYQDEALWNRLSDASVQNVEEHFSLATARASLTELFDSFEKQPE